MQAHDDRDQFAPPRPPARLRAIVLAVLAHGVLIAALTWGVHWKASTDQPAVQAELWAAVPQQAAPRAEAPPEPPPPAPQPQVTPPPAPPTPRQAQPDTREADLAIEREKKRIEKERKERELQAERDKREKERLQKEKEQQRDKERQEKEKEKRLAEEKKQKEAEIKHKQEALEKASAKAAEERRQDALRRMQGLAGATGGETATGNAQRDAGPSGSYGGRVAAKVKPNIVYPDAITGSPRAEVEVRAAPDGTITGVRLVQSSGNKAWDDAVLRALQKTETLPRDVDGRVPATLIIGFKP